VMKVNNLDRFPAEAERLRHELASVEGILIERYLSRQDTYALLNSCDAYISLHRSEGYGLTLAEAMALGKPVIGTGYSGNTDFMSVNTSYLIPYELVALTRAHPPYQAGNVWAEPDVKEAARALREVYEHPERGRQRGLAAADYMRRHHHPRVVGAATAARLRYILKHMPAEITRRPGGTAWPST
jgi:glycosyltransferase involved in cell wall biosynthesis